MRATDTGKTSLVCLLALLLILPTVAPLRVAEARQSAAYSITDLGTLGGNQSRAFGVNNYGVVAGDSRPTSGSSDSRPFAWQAETMTSLGTLGGSVGIAYAVNDSGLVTGGAKLLSDGMRPFVWSQATGMANIGTLGGETIAFDVNNSGQVVGQSEVDPSNFTDRGFIWSSSTGMVGIVNTLGGSSSAARGINDLGQVVGDASVSSTETHAFRYSNGAMIDLGTLGGSISRAFKINNNGVVVGYSTTASGVVTPPRRAFTWKDDNNNGQSDVGEMKNLGTLGGNVSEAYDVNDAGVTVGYSTNASNLARAFVHDATNGMRDLNSLIPAGSGWVLTQARSINNWGQIVGFGTKDGETRAFLLTPTTPVQTYTISGRLADGAGSAISGATITLSVSQVATTTTNSNGEYSFTVPAGGTYTVTPSKANYSFTQAGQTNQPSRTFNNLSSNQTAGFTGTSVNVSYVISGRVSLSGGAALPGVTVSLSGSQTDAKTTDANGDYSFTVPAGGSYTITPSKTNYSFSPPPLTFTNLGGNQTANFTASLVNYVIGGRVATASGAAVSDITVTLTGSLSDSKMTDANGEYFFTVPAEGNYTITPSSQIHTFSPQNHTFNNLSASQAADFTATLKNFTVSGRVTTSGSGLGNVTVELTASGFTTRSTVTDSSGNYSFAGVPAGTTYTVTPSAQFYAFTPATRTFTLTGDNTTADFTAALTTALVQVKEVSLSVGEGGKSVEVVVERTGVNGTAMSVAYSTADGTASKKSDYAAAIGRLRFAAGEVSKSVTVLIIDDRYDEAAETFTFTLSAPVGGALGTNSTATITINDNDAADGPSPVGDAGFDAPFFVRQQYLDFLNREPDDDGLAFWVNQIISCGSDAACRELRRINASGAFFLSIEFQETGYLVYRIYKSAFGNLQGKPVPVRLEEFLPDTQEIGQGVIVRADGWEQKLEANKRAFTEEFVTRERFTSAFPSTMTATEFVNKLDENAGNVLSGTEKAQLVAELGTAPNDSARRASVLRKVAENTKLASAEKNLAFVLMQYFGYLRRNPDDAPDSNFAGLEFWLSKLNSQGGNFVDAEMVKSFLVSDEYVRRFGL